MEACNGGVAKKIVLNLHPSAIHFFLESTKAEMIGQLRLQQIRFKLGLSLGRSWYIAHEATVAEIRNSQDYAFSTPKIDA
jgi:hypothetical protein